MRKKVSNDGGRKARGSFNGSQGSVSFHRGPLFSTIDIDYRVMHERLHARTWHVIYVIRNTAVGSLGQGPAAAVGFNSHGSRLL